jgi:hypothetical protein
VAIVMDGNGRWASARGLPRTRGHEAGERALFDVVSGALEVGLPWLSAYAFSTENWRRPADEVRFLMNFNSEVLSRRRDELNDLGVRVLWAGRSSRLSARAVREPWQRELLERLAFRDADLDRRIREYSSGMKRKLAIVSAFQADAPLLVLDEPTEGLDPLMQEAFYALLAEVRQRGTTVFLSSHVLSEVDRVCDRIGVLRTGELVLEAPVEQVRRMAPRIVRVAFREPVPPPPTGWPPHIEIVSLSAAQWSLRVRGSTGPVVESLAGLPVADLDVREPRLEDVVIQYYREAPCRQAA